MTKKALLVTRVSGFVPQFEMNNVKILQEMGYEVHYAADFHHVVYGKDNHRLDGTGIVCHQIDFKRSPFSRGVKKSFQQLKALLRKEQFDLIHCHMPMTGVLARKAAQSVRKETGREVPVLYTAHGFHFYDRAPLINWLYYPVERHMSRVTDRLIVINNEDYERAKKFPVRGKVEQIMGIGMPLDRFEKYQKTNWKISETQEVIQQQSDAGMQESIYDKYDIPAEHAIIISVGELTKLKNHMVVIQAMQELGDLPITYLICGSGPKENELQEEIKELGLKQRVKLAGYVTNIPELLMQADCFVFPSRREGLPVAMMEAMAVGLPVIATRMRGITDLLEHTKGGYLVDDWEPENYAVKIRRMFTQSDGKSDVKRDIRRKEMGEWNRQQIKKFALPVVEKKMREIYQDVSQSENQHRK